MKRHLSTVVVVTVLATIAFGYVRYRQVWVSNLTTRWAAMDIANQFVKEWDSRHFTVLMAPEFRSKAERLLSGWAISTCSQQAYDNVGNTWYA